MDTKYLSELPDTIDKLLKSTNIDDVVLGVILTKEKMGVQWIKDNFLFGDIDNRGDRYLLFLSDKTEKVIKFKEISVLVGSICLEAFDHGKPRYNKEVIYEE